MPLQGGPPIQGRYFLKDYIDGVVDDDEILEILEPEVREISAVDQPATGIRFSHFKRAKDFPGLGSEGGSPNSTLPDLTRFHDQNPTLGPALAEAEPGVREALVDDFDGAGDDGQVPALPTSPHPATGKGDGSMTARKQEGVEEMAVEPAAPEMPAAEVTEVEVTPVAWPLTQCIADAQELGLPENESVSVCQLIREELGDPEDPESILVPENLTPEGLITTAAMSLGVAKPAGDSGGGGTEEMPVEGELRAKPKRRNRWVRKLKDGLGLNRKPSILERRVKRLEKEMKLSTKTNRDLMEVIRLQSRYLAARAGIELPDDDDLLANGGRDAVGEVEVAAEAIAATEPEKRAKDEPAAAVAEAPADLDEDERAELERLRELEASLKDGADASLGAETAAELESVSLEEPAEPEPVAVAEIPVEPVLPTPEPAKRGRRTSRAPGQKSAPAPMRPSSFLRDERGRGLLINEDDAKALWD
jgi:hypothetical protein